MNNNYDIIIASTTPQKNTALVKEEEYLATLGFLVTSDTISIVLILPPYNK